MISNVDKICQIIQHVPSKSRTSILKGFSQNIRRNSVASRNTGYISSPKFCHICSRNGHSTHEWFSGVKKGTYGCWLVGCCGLNGPLRQYFSLYRAVSQREGERGEKRIDVCKNVQTTPTRTHYKRSRPLPYCNPNCRTPRHWKFTQHHRTTRPPPPPPHTLMDVAPVRSL